MVAECCPRSFESIAIRVGATAPAPDEVPGARGLGLGYVHGLSISGGWDICAEVVAGYCWK